MAGYMPQLDGLRALAVFAVIFSHAGPTGLAHALQTGPLGVRLFFVLSGFLITGILLRTRPESDRSGGEARAPAPAHDPEGTSRPARREPSPASTGVALRAFYARRFLRIFPLYYAVLFTATALALPGTRETFTWNVLYLSNYYYALHGEWLGSVGHFWSLAVEEQFYLVWPWLILFTPIRRLPLLLGATVLLGPLSRMVLIRSTDSLIAASTPMIACLDSLGAGALLAWLWYAAPASVRLRWMTRGALIAGLACGAILLLFWQLNTGWTLRVGLWDLAASLVFVWLVDRAARGFTGPVGALLSSRPLVYLGAISYGLYVFHPLIEPMFTGLAARLHLPVTFPPDGGALRFTLVSGLSILIASLSWHFFERPLNALKSRFAYTGRTDRGQQQARH
jgi:peptidoglycan/LPS O-acetylase OafA/YrhL